jgi:tetratricopeptide (TPR) repeat protein
LEDVAAALEAYEVEEELGRGSWGIVLAGRHRRLEREVAIKQLPPALAADPGVRARFLAEGRLLASLDHPHIVPVYDFVEREAMCLLVMERLRGGTVADLAVRARPTPQVACALALPACAALHHAHGHGVLHRDVKPDNLLFSASGTLKVADFGIAKMLGGKRRSATSHGELLGTPAFMAPEQVEGTGLSAATDVYALATTLFLLLSGQLPFPREEDLGALLYRRVNEAPRPLLEVASDLPPELAGVVDTALARDPADRQAGAEELGVAIARAAVEAWGPAWLAETGVVLASAGPIAAAATGEGRAASIAGSAVETVAPVERLPAAGDVERGREAYARRAWIEADESLSRADAAGALGAEDLERFATVAYMLGRNEDHYARLGRAHDAYLQDGEPMRAAYCAFWTGMNLFADGEMGRANGWLGRAERLIDRSGRESALQGYMLFPEMFRHAAAGDRDAAIRSAAGAAAFGERYADADLFALGSCNQGQFLVEEGRVVEGLRLLDEAMLAVTGGKLSPIVSGFVYCGVILGCRDAYDPRRAKEWTAALSRWCDQQPDVVAFSGRCQVHRAEIMQLQGAWPDALEEARRARERCVGNESALGAAFYVRGEVHRLRGERGAAEDAYREASRCGYEPQPGLALLRLGQGDGDAALAAIRRVLAETGALSRRAGLLPACVEILLAAGEVQEARSACGELEEIAAAYGAGMLAGMAAYARGATDLAEGDAAAALVAARKAWRVWEETEAPYETARSRVLVGLACRALGDEDAAALELEAARDLFQELGAGPDVARIDSLVGTAPPADAHGPTPR